MQQLVDAGLDHIQLSFQDSEDAEANTFAGTISGMTVNVTYPDGLSTGTSRVTVSVTDTYVSVFRIPGISQTLTVSSTGRILY